MTQVPQIHDSATGEIIHLPQQGIVRPAISPNEALEAWNEYQKLKAAIATDDDYQDFQGRKFPRKSLWRKLATVFNLSIEMVSEKEIKNEDGSIDFDLLYKAIAPNGRSCVGDGSCNSKEKGGRENSRHNTRSTASTRAFNRAVSNLIGGGEVSAEEMEREDYSIQVAPREAGKGSPPPSLPNPFEPSKDYKIDLGLQKSGKPHWLNTLSLEEADSTESKSGGSMLKETYDYLNSKGYRNEKITEFLNQVKSFYEGESK